MDDGAPSGLTAEKMCGRYTLTSPWKEIVGLYRLTDEFSLKPRYNISPSQAVAAIRMDRDRKERELVLLRWGLIPHWAKDEKIGYRTINARAETVEKKPAFRDAFKKRRCLIAADSYYEWKKTPVGLKQPYRITLVDGGPFSFAGLWERWEKPDSSVVESCTIITTSANAVTRNIHDRMPVILAPEDYDAWLDPDAEQGKALLRPCSGDWLTNYPVSTHVNSPRNDDRLCIRPLAVSYASSVDRD